MPQVTAIEPQKKRIGRFNIYLDGHFAFGVDENILVKNQLKVNRQLTDDQVLNLINQSILGKLTDQALRFLSYRPRSEKEVADYLVKKISQGEGLKYNQAKESPMIGKIIAKLTRYGYLNDHEFARWWFDSRMRARPKGPTLIKAELIKKGIDKEIIENVQDRSPDQVALAKKAVAKKLEKWQKLPQLEFKKKLYQFLLSRGFDYQTVAEVFAYLAKKR